jgi:predicted enzyme related to lactoylglutathione lyase
MSQHPIVHVDFATSDPKATGRFLADLFGWQVETNEAFHYVMWQPQNGPGGGLVTVDNQGFRPGEALVYVGTDDIDDTLARARDLGATVVEPKHEVTGFGWWAVLTDAAGARVALYQALPR